MLRASVAAGPSGPVIILSGEADITSAAELSALISAHLPAEPQELTLDMSGLRYADSASIRTLVLAARMLQERGAILVLLHPQAAVARMLALMGVDQILTIRAQTQGAP
ncbi:MAG: STAS domain-containing protein [Streptosporangiaceae bacterium]